MPKLPPNLFTRAPKPIIGDTNGAPGYYEHLLTDREMHFLQYEGVINEQPEEGWGPIGTVDVGRQMYQRDRT